MSDLAGILHPQGEVGLTLTVDLGVEHLVLEEHGGPRLQVDVRPGGLDDLVARAGSRRGRDLQPTRGSRVRGGGRDPQARSLGPLRGGGKT